MQYVKYNDDGSIWGVSGKPFPGAVDVEDGSVVQVDGVWYDKATAPVKTPEQLQAERQMAIRAEFTAAVQGRLDSFARERGYDGIMSAASYATSTDAVFRAEGERAVALRDATWRACYALLGEVASGKRPVPTLEDVFEALPELTWGDA